MEVSGWLQALATLLLGKEPWVSPRVGTDMVAKRKDPCWEWNPRHPACSLVSILTELKFVNLRM